MKNNSLYEEPDKIFEEEQLNEMALPRRLAIDKCQELGEQFIIHFNKIYENRENQSVNHWCNEMQSWFDKVSKYKLKETNKHITWSSLQDWFFTACAIGEDYLKHDNEVETYDEFINSLYKTRNVRESLINIGLIRGNE